MSMSIEYVIIVGAAQQAKDDAHAIIADAGGYTLLKGPGIAANFGSAAYAYLTKEEANDSKLSHLFVDYTTMDVSDRIELTGSLILRDEALLTRVRRDAIGYFYAKDQTPAERAAALTRYNSALSMAMAGSVEGTAEALSLVTPDDADEGAFQALIAARLTEHLLKFPR